AVVVGALWLLAKVVERIASTAQEAVKSYDEAAQKRKDSRYSKKRLKFKPYVQFELPNELDEFERKYEAKRLKLEQGRMQTQRVVTAPSWQNPPFKSIPFPRKDAKHSEMCVDDLQAILMPNSESSTWAYEESKIIGRQCSFPSKPPVGSLERFSELPALMADLKVALFGVDSSKITGKDVERYFADDRNLVNAYNNRRSELLSKTAVLNRA